jgi:nucleoside-diphosphate-sugar epimerase
VLVTGGAGSLGRRVVARFLAGGRRVRVLDLPGMDYSGLEEMPGIEIVRADISDGEEGPLRTALAGVAAVVHLAALLPPRSEADRERTFAVNVGGTERLANLARREAPQARFVFSSSVTVYGATGAGGEAPIGTEQARRPMDPYAQSKMVGEDFLLRELPSAAILRISGIAVPAFQEPPDPWPFTEEQRIEFVHREDAVGALCEAAFARGAAGCVLNVAGGPTWRTTGGAYVKDYFDLLGVAMEEARFGSSPGPFGWYDTADSQKLLGYQATPYRTYMEQMKSTVDAMMGE